MRLRLKGVMQRHNEWMVQTAQERPLGEGMPHLIAHEHVLLFHHLHCKQIARAALSNLHHTAVCTSTQHGEQLEVIEAHRRRILMAG